MNNFYNSIKLFYLTSKFFGTFQFSIHKNELELKTFYIFYSICVASFTFYLYKMRQQDLRHDNALLDSVLQIRFAFSISSSISIYFQNFFMYRKFEKLIKNFEDFDRKTEFDGRKFLKISKVSFCYLWFKFLAFTFLVFFSYQNKMPITFLVMVIVTQLFTVLPVVSHTIMCVVIILGINERFKVFNKMLKEIFIQERNFERVPKILSQNTKSSKIKFKNFQNISKINQIHSNYLNTHQNSLNFLNLSQLFLLNLKLVEIIKNFNAFFLFSISIFNGSALTGIITNLFTLYLNLTGKDENPLYYLETSFAWNISIQLLNLFVIFACCKVNNEIKRSQLISYDGIVEIKNKKVRKKFEIFILQLKHTKVKFSCGLYEFDWEIIAMVR